MMIWQSLVFNFVLFNVVKISLSQRVLTHERSRQILCRQGYLQFCSTATFLDSHPPVEEGYLEEQSLTTAATPKNNSFVDDTRSEFRSFKEHNFEMTGQEPPTERVHSRNHASIDDRHEAFDRKESTFSGTSSIMQLSNNPTVLEEMFIRMLTGDEANESAKERLLSVSHRRLKKLCWKYYPAAKMHCSRRRMKPKFREKCSGYFEDCRRFIYPQNPLDEMSQAYQSNIRLQYYNQVTLPLYQQSTATSYNFANSDDNRSNRWYNENEWISLG